MVEALEVLPRCLAPFDDGVWTRRPTVGLRSRLHVDVVEHRFDSDNYGIELVPLGLGLLLQHIELCLNPPTIVCRHHKDPSSQQITLAVTLTTKYSPFSSSASFSAHPDSFVLSYRSCSMAWCSWPSSASCSTSTTVISHNMAFQQCKVISPIRHTFLLLGDFPQLLGLGLQLLGSTR